MMYMCNCSVLCHFCIYRMIVC